MLRRVPQTSLVSLALESVLDKARQAPPGQVADYIPELAGADPEQFGLAIVSALGHVYSAGDADHPFTIQSASKPFVYALALEDLGLEEVHGHVGMEPSGQPFNAISLDENGRPANPMINAGAIVTSALIEGRSPAARFDRIRSTLGAFAGRELDVDEDVYASEAATGDRNRALAYLTRTGGSLVREVADATEVYFRQCSVLATAHDLATMGATLATGGINPVTDQRVVSATTARLALSMMTSCGMYDASGTWMLEVGLPAKSGVGGGIVAVAPGEFGIGVFSPPLDHTGNSSRGVAALVELSDHYGLHLLRTPAAPASPVVRIASDPAGNITAALRGELHFMETEQVVYDIAAHLPDTPVSVTIDLSSVTRVSEVARELLRGAADRVGANRGVEIVFLDPLQVLAP